MKILFHDTQGKMPFEQTYVDQAVRFFADTLFGDTCYNNLHLEIALTEPEEDGCLGETITYDFDEVSTPEFIDITLVKHLSDEDFMTTLAHEMVHVWQLATGSLIVDEETLNISWHKFVNHGDDYNDTPWEQEANEYESILVDKWKHHVDAAKNQKT